MNLKITPRRFLSISVNVLTLCVWIAVIACCWCNHISPLKSVYAPLVYMFSPYMMIFGIILIIISLFWCKRLALAGTLLMATCLPQALAFCPLHFSRTIVDESISTDTFSVMSFNAYYFNSFKTPSRDSIAVNDATLAILEADPDIVVIQEGVTYDIFENHRLKNLSPELSEQIRTLYPYRHYSSDAMGILSKYPFKTAPMPNYNPSGQMSFIVERYDFQIGDSVLNLYNLHLQSLFLSTAELGIIARIAGGNAEQIKRTRGDLMNKIKFAYRRRAQQAEVVRALVDSVASKPVIVCGDFNDVPECWAVRTIAGDNYKDVYAASGLGPAASYRKYNLYFRIDQMLCSESLKPLGSKVLRKGESDHFPLFTLFTFRNKK